VSHHGPRRLRAATDRGRVSRQQPATRRCAGGAPPRVRTHTSQRASSGASSRRLPSVTGCVWSWRKPRGGRGYRGRRFISKPGLDCCGGSADTPAPHGPERSSFCWEPPRRATFCSVHITALWRAAAPLRVLATSNEATRQDHRAAERVSSVAKRRLAPDEHPSTQSALRGNLLGSIIEHAARTRRRLPR
jgi:hypothetical protein